TASRLNGGYPRSSPCNIPMEDGRRLPSLQAMPTARARRFYTLHEAGVPASDPAYQRGVEYLVRTQLQDGSWHVKSRAPKFQPYFQSRFPHDHDQWISASATAWAAMGLAEALDSKQVAG